MYDAIVIGARCAGGSTALLLARKGHKVLLLDQSKFPSDRTMSTHMIWHGGTDCLKRWGLLDKLKAAGCPTMKKMSLDFGEFVLAGTAVPFGETDEAVAPRRVLLDGMLVDEAKEAGAEFRDECQVNDFILEDGRVCGVRYTTKDGSVVEERAKIVVGAEGTHSPLAKFVEAEEYNAHPKHQGTIWAYFSDMKIDDMEFYTRPARMVYAWYTSDNQTVVGICFRHEDFLEAKKDPDATMARELAELTPEFADRVNEATMDSAWISGSCIGVCRKPAGPGWALVGDAGFTIDPISAAGITNALRHAELLSEKISEGLTSDKSLDEALATFEDERNEMSLPLYEFTKEMSKLDPAPQEMVDLFTAAQYSEEAIAAYFGLFSQALTPPDFFNPEFMGKIFEAAAEATAGVEGKAQVAA